MSRNAFWGSDPLFQNRDEVQVRLGDDEIDFINKVVENVQQ